jgi:phosphoribosylaminoimidazolecarboxamide formyltransferase/IMP cyclohydrolase
LAARRSLAAKVFAHTAAYDTDVAEWMRGDVAGDAAPDEWTVGGRKAFDLRYGENPHQTAAFYATGVQDTGLAGAKFLQGKALSYNNLLDADGCLRMVEDLAGEVEPACVIVKHTNPCGVALASSAAEAFEQARSCDPVSFFGGIVGFTVAVDEAAARALCEHFLEVILAPSFTDEALAILARKKRLRVLELTPGTLSTVRSELEVRRVRGGLIVQTPDAGPLHLDDAQVATNRAPTDAERRALTLAWRMCRHVKSNAIVFADERRLIGVGAGQMSRVDAAKLAADRAVLPLPGSVAASDAFFPFRDGLDAIAAAGATAVVQPGGSKRDSEIVAAADEHGMAMLLTGQRHFRH